MVLVNTERELKLQLFSYNSPGDMCAGPGPASIRYPINAEPASSPAPDRIYEPLGFDHRPKPEQLNS